VMTDNVVIDGDRFVEKVAATGRPTGEAFVHPPMTSRPCQTHPNGRGLRSCRRTRPSGCLAQLDGIQVRRQSRPARTSSVSNRSYTAA
jgi:hypothetical protein